MYLYASTSIVESAFFPPKLTVKFCFTPVFVLSKFETLTLPSGKLIVVEFPLANKTLTLAPVKFKSSPLLYTVFVGWLIKLTLLIVSFTIIVSSAVLFL